jgi:hypothetical protein
VYYLITLVGCLWEIGLSVQNAIAGLFRILGKNETMPTHTVEITGPHTISLPVIPSDDVLIPFYYLPTIYKYTIITPIMISLLRQLVISIIRTRVAGGPRCNDR